MEDARRMRDLKALKAVRGKYPVRNGAEVCP